MEQPEGHELALMIYENIRTPRDAARLLLRMHPHLVAAAAAGTIQTRSVALVEECLRHGATCRQHDHVGKYAVEELLVELSRELTE